MRWLREVFGRVAPGIPWGRRSGLTSRKLVRKIKHTDVAAKCAFSFGWQRHAHSFGLVEHSARVALLARWIGEQLDLDPTELDTLEHAAQMHEVGMIAVPRELIETPRPLSTDELQSVRAHAWVGGNIVRASYEPIKGDIIANQYTEFAFLPRQVETKLTVELAGILRVADVFDTMLNPRPYQEGIPRNRWLEVIGGGIGSSFHPGAAALLIQIAAVGE